MKRTTTVSLVVSAFVVLCVGAACLTLVSVGPAANTLMGCRDSTAPTVGSVKSDVRRIPELFPALAADDVTATWWQARDARPHTCPEIGPMDQLYNGFVTLSAAAAQRYAEGYRWEPAGPPDIPPDLRAHAPESPQWTRSAEFDRDVAGSAPVFLFDRAHGTLWFAKLVG